MYQIISNRATGKTSSLLLLAKDFRACQSKEVEESNEYYEEYMIQTSPRYFIRPAIQETLDEIGQLMIQETNDEYMKNRRQSNGDDI